MLKHKRIFLGVVLLALTFLVLVVVRVIDLHSDESPQFLSSDLQSGLIEEKTPFSVSEQQQALQEKSNDDNLASNSHDGSEQAGSKKKPKLSQASCEQISDIINLINDLESEPYSSYGFSIFKFAEYDQYSNSELDRKISTADPYAVEMKAIRLSLTLFQLQIESEESRRAYENFKTLSEKSLADGSHSIIFTRTNAERAMALLALQSDKLELAKARAVESMAWLKLQEFVWPHNEAQIDSFKDLMASNFEKKQAELDLLWLEVEAEKQQAQLLSKVNYVRSQKGLGPLEPNPLISAYSEELRRLDSSYYVDIQLEDEATVIAKSYECGLPNLF